MLKNTSDLGVSVDTRRSGSEADAVLRHRQQAFDYTISGISVRSQVEIPSAIARVRHGEAPEVTISAATVPEHLPAPLRAGADFEADETQFLLRVPGVARFLIRDGREILFEAAPGHDPGDLTLFLLGSCFAALLQQRGSLVLHASAVSVQGCAMLFCGQSGAGKSTMAAMLCERGYPLLNDDVCSLRPSPQGGYTVTPDGRMLKLWAQSVEFLELKSRRGPAVRSNTDKFYLAPAQSEGMAQPVGGIYVLEAAAAGETATLRRLSALQAMLELRRNSYRPTLVWAMAMEAAYFKATAALQSGIGVYMLRRPLAFEGAAATLDLLESHWQTLGSRPLLGVESAG
jgi:hypothetical protein